MAKKIGEIGEIVYKERALRLLLLKGFCPNKYKRERVIGGLDRGMFGWFGIIQWWIRYLQMESSCSNY